jgi:hypothetical protein
LGVKATSLGLLNFKNKEINKIMKLWKKSIIKSLKIGILSFVFFNACNTVQATEINPEKLIKIRSYISEVRHPNHKEMLSRIREIEPTEPEVYLMKIADDPAQIGAVRLKVYGLLGNFDDNTSVQGFLENRIVDPSLNESYRSIAVSSYVKVYYSNNKVRVEQTLKKLDSDRSANLKNQAGDLLHKMKSGELKPNDKSREIQNPPLRTNSKNLDLK